ELRVVAVGRRRVGETFGVVRVGRGRLVERAQRLVAHGLDLGHLEREGGGELLLGRRRGRQGLRRREPLLDVGERLLPSVEARLPLHGSRRVLAGGGDRAG